MPCGLRFSLPFFTSTRQVAQRPLPKQLRPGYLKIHGCNWMPALSASVRRLEPAGISISRFSFTNVIFAIFRVLSWLVLQAVSAGRSRDLAPYPHLRGSCHACDGL